jgi:hypothetical protein
LIVVPVDVLSEYDELRIRIVAQQQRRRPQKIRIVFSVMITAYATHQQRVVRNS